MVVGRKRKREGCGMTGREPEARKTERSRVGFFVGPAAYDDGKQAEHFFFVDVRALDRA